MESTNKPVITFLKRAVDYNGNVGQGVDVKDIPAKYIKKYEEVIQQDKDIRNRLSRARYADHKAVERYNVAKETDRVQRKANRLANKNNTEALQIYRDAGGNTEAARARWTNNGQNVNQAALDPSLETLNWNMVPMEDCFKHRNATLRSNIIEHYGMNAIIATLKYDVVDEDTIDGRKYRLLDVEIPDQSIVRIDREDGVQTTHKGLYLEMINPSTGESHFEGVANVGNWNGLKKATVREALKWRDGDDEVQRINSNTPVWKSNNDGATLDYIKPEVLT